MELILMEQVKDMLRDYFGITVPDDFLIKVIDSDVEIQEEVEAGAVYDTYVRDIIGNAVCKNLGISVPVANLFGKTDSYEWPCYGDTDAYKEAFYQQASVKLTAIGGKLEQ